MKKSKGADVTKGPNGPKVKSSKIKHIQVLKGLVVQIINLGVAEKEKVNDLEVPFMYEDQLMSTINNLKYEARAMITQLLKAGYLAVRTPHEDQGQATYWLCATKKIGETLRRQTKVA